MTTATAERTLAHDIRTALAGDLTPELHDLLLRIDAEVSGRLNASADALLHSLSYTEAEVLRAFLEAHVDGAPTVCSAVADTMGVARSTLVIALSKTALAGLATVRSLGSKGTHVRWALGAREALLARLN